MIPNLYAHKKEAKNEAGVTDDTDNNINPAKKEEYLQEMIDLLEGAGGHVGAVTMGDAARSLADATQQLKTLKRMGVAATAATPARAASTTIVMSDSDDEPNDGEDSEGRFGVGDGLGVDSDGNSSVSSSAHSDAPEDLDDVDYD